MKQKRRIAISAMIIFVLSYCAIPVQAFTSIVEDSKQIQIVYDAFVPYHYEGEEKQNYRMLEYGDTVLYSMKQSEEPIQPILDSQELFENTNCRKILTYGYPHTTYEEMKLENKLEAYLATQEAIYIVLEHKDIKKYIAEDEVGTRILKATQTILETLKQEEIRLQELDTMWKKDPQHENQYYKQYQVEMNPTIETAKIQLQNVEDGVICNSQNEPINEIQQGDIIKIVLPNGKNRLFSVKLSYTTQEAIAYRCYRRENSNIKYIASTFEEIDKEQMIDIEFEALTKVTIINHDYETKEKIEGSKFQILDQNKQVLMTDLMTNEEGKIEIYLDQGEYYLEQLEVKVPYERVFHLNKINTQNKKQVEFIIRK